MKIITGFEPTRIITKDKGLSDTIDVLETTRHDILFSEDLDLLQDVGISTLRVAVPWHRIEKKRGHYDWEWMDKYMSSLKERNIDPIMDPLHHVSIPSWLKDGFLDKEYVVSYCTFFRELVHSYPWVTKYTILNEPTVTTIFATRDGIWYPYHTSTQSFEKAMSSQLEILHSLSLFLKEEGKEHWFIDSTEYHVGTCEQSSRHAAYCNTVRYHLLDKLLEKGGYVTVLGMDYYAHSEFLWDSKGRISTEEPIGFYALAKQYYERYQLPLSLTETNIRGFAEDRWTWFVHMYEQCLLLEKEIPFRGFCWYPFIDSTDWDSLLQNANHHIDPQGIILLDDHFQRHPNIFSDNVKKLIQGTPLSQLPTYPFQYPLSEQLEGFIKKFKL